MAQQISSPPEKPQRRVSQLIPVRSLPASRRGIVLLLVVVALMLMLFSGLLVANLPQVINRYTQAAQAGPGVPQVLDLPLLPSAAQGTNALLQIPDGHYALYEQRNKIYLVPAGGSGKPQAVNTPGYIYNRAVPPILMPSGRLLYSGSGLWLTDVFQGGARQIASISSNQVITSMLLSNDNTMVAWSTEPTDGRGDVNIYAGPLDSSTIVYQQRASDCPCFRVFSFLPGDQENTILLLTNDLGDHHLVQHGLWSLNLADLPMRDPQPLLNSDVTQGPLALLPNGTLLFAPYEGVVPAPTDGSTPPEIDALNYANSLSVAPIIGKQPNLGNVQTILPQQMALKNSAEYHWVATPQFSPSGDTLAYVVFSSDDEAPFNRHSSLYTVQIKGSGMHLSVGKPQLFSPSPSLFVELGPWLDNRILTFYADNAIYAVDVQSKAITMIVQTGSYVHIVALI